jgi:hypothetical protein
MPVFLSPESETDGMSQRSLADRVKSWFGVAHVERPRRADVGAKPWTASSTAPAAGLFLAGAGGTATAAPPISSPFDARPAAPLAGGPASETLAVTTEEADKASAVQRPEPNPEWIRLLNTLPERIAESLAASAAGAKALEKIGRELEGHRDATRSLAESVRQLPDLATDQAAVTKRTNDLLEQQTRLAEATVDGLTGMRAALRSVEESAQRHLVCIARLETAHREVLETYQSLVLRTHRRLGRLAMLAVLLASAALGGVGYALYLTLRY